MQDILAYPQPTPIVPHGPLNVSQICHLGHGAPRFRATCQSCGDSQELKVPSNEWKGLALNADD